MSRKSKSIYGTKLKHETKSKGTSIGRNPITSTMNKSKRRMRKKKYRGQGRWQMSSNILYIQYERKRNKYKSYKYYSETVDKSAYWVKSY